MKRGGLWIIIFLTLLSAFIDLPKINGLPSINIPKVNIDLTSLIGSIPLKLGLDLQGGSQLVLEADTSKLKSEDRDTALQSATDVLDRRVNLFGVSEAVVQSSKIGEQRRILVDLPGIKNSSEAASLVGKTAQLDFRELSASISASQSGILALETTTSTGLGGSDLKKASVVFGDGSGQNIGSPQISIEFTSEGAQKFADITKRNINKPLAIFLDDVPVSAPTVQQEIIGGSAVISGQFTTAQAKTLAVQLNAGALPVPIKILEQRSIGPSLGQESINKSIIAGIIGLLTVLIYMVFYYGWWGVVADIALIIYSLFVLAIFKTGLFVIPPVTLTLAGIAGFILSIGMAVDANILIFERMKEEKRWGKSNKQSLELGFNRAWSSIRDSNISSLMTAGILYFMATGVVKGFAVTLAIGVLVSMFTAITVTKTLLKLVIK